MSRQLEFLDHMRVKAYESVVKRIPPQEWLSPSDVATAYDRSLAMIYRWIEEGSIFARSDAGGSKNSAWRIYRPSVIAFAKKQFGIEETETTGTQKGMRQ